MALIEIKMKVYRPRANYRNLKTMTETQREEQLKEQPLFINKITSLPRLFMCASI